MLFGLVNPIVHLLITGNIAKYNITLFWFYLAMLGISIAVILATVLMMLPYASIIDNLDKEYRDIEEKKKELRQLTDKYNKLILAETDKNEQP